MTLSLLYLTCQDKHIGDYRMIKQLFSLIGKQRKQVTELLTFFGCHMEERILFKK